jgi:hypothetical protein
MVGICALSILGWIMISGFPQTKMDQYFLDQGIILILSFFLFEFQQ